MNYRKRKKKEDFFLIKKVILTLFVVWGWGLNELHLFQIQYMHKEKMGVGGDIQHDNKISITTTTNDE
jgi:hypothetical protein